MARFEIHSKFQPTGDQPQAIDRLVKGIEAGDHFQTLRGVTGSGKTFTMANIIARVQKPTLVIAHNKTLASQLAAEFKEFFPDNAVEFFVSYYDYYQPEAYVAATDTYIAKDASINDEIDRLRHSATTQLFQRKDVIVVASVSCIYGLGDPEDYISLTLSLRMGQVVDRDEVLRRLVEIQFVRNDVDFQRGTFRVKGDTVDIFPAAKSSPAIRVTFFGDEIDQIVEFDDLTGEILDVRNYVMIYPASHFATTKAKMARAIETIEEELEERLSVLQAEKKLVEAQRLEQRTRYDLEMMKEIGFCSGIENYSRHISGRPAGSRPYTLIDYFPRDFLMVIDESHATLPQLRGMINGDMARKQNLIDYGFRLPSALDNRPLKFEEWEGLVNQAIFMSATPGPYEKEHSSQMVDQVIRPTGLLDPEVEVRPTSHQIDDLIGEIRKRTALGDRTLVTTLTKKMAEDLTNYLEELGIRVTYMHSDVATMDRMAIIRDLRLKKYDVLVGINLLREGLDIPEVSLIAILDADKEGFLRSEISLIQTIGRAARNVRGKVLLYGDQVTGAMRVAIEETERRRRIQQDFNRTHHIQPRSVEKKVHDLLSTAVAAEETGTYLHDPAHFEQKKTLDRADLQALLVNMDLEMRQAAEELDFERAARIRDAIRAMKQEYQLD